MKFITYNRRSIFYSIVVTFGLFFLMVTEKSSPSLFLIFTLILYLVVLFEMYFTWFISKEKLKQFNLPLMSSYTKFKEFLHHLVLPSLLLFSLAGFIYFNNQLGLRIPLLIISFIVFLSLFVNLRAFYQDKFGLEQSTYYVYDIIEMIIFFSFTNFILHFVEINNLSSLLAVFFIGLLTLILLTLNLYQSDNLNLRDFAFILVLTFLMIIISLFLIFFTTFTLIGINFLIFLGYYFLFGLLSHRLDSSLNWTVGLEYLSVFLICLGFLFGIS